MEKILFDKGEWLVHKNYGTGQIRGIESKQISGEPAKYYKFQTEDSIIWLPLSDLDDDLIRPLSTEDEIQEAIQVLKKPPKEMASNFNKRKSRINRVQSSNRPVRIARLVRDLRERRRQEGGLRAAERRALRSLTKKLVQEWSVCMGIKVDSARKKLDQLLQKEQV